MVSLVFEPCFRFSLCLVDIDARVTGCCCDSGLRDGIICQIFIVDQNKEINRPRVVRVTEQ